MMNESTYSISETAEFLKVSNKTIYRWIEGGQLAANEAEYGTRVPVAEIERFLAVNGLSMADLADRIFGIKDIANLLHISIQAAHLWANQGYFETHQLSPRTTLVTHSEVRRFLAEAGLTFADCEAGLMSQKEVARLLRIYPTTVGRWGSSGRLKLHHIPVDGRTTRITQKSLDIYLRTRGLRYQDVEAGPLMLLSEVMALLRISLSTLHRWIKKGVIEIAYLADNNIRVSRLFLDRFFRERGSSLAEAEKGLLRLNEYAARYSIPREKVYALIVAGKIPVIRLLPKTLRIPVKRGL
jgi:excisionase family DNA binding protein